MGDSAGSGGAAGLCAQEAAMPQHSGQKAPGGVRGQRGSRCAARLEEVTNWTFGWEQEGGGDMCVCVCVCVFV